MMDLQGKKQQRSIPNITDPGEQKEKAGEGRPVSLLLFCSWDLESQYST